MTSSTPGIAASASARRAASAAPRRYTKSSPTCIASQPQLRAKPSTDGWWRLAGLEAAGVGEEAERRPDSAACRTRSSRRPSAGSGPSPPGRPTGRPSPRARAATSGPGSRRRRRRAPRRRPGSPRRPGRRRRATRAPRAWARSAIARTGRPAPVDQATWETATSRVPGVMAASKAASVRSSSPPPPMSTRTSVDAAPVAQRPGAGARPPTCSSVVDDPVAGLPVEPQRRDVHPVGRRVGERDRVDVGGEDRRDRRPCLVHPLDGGRGSRRTRRGRRVSSISASSAIARRGLARDAARRAGVEVDPGARRGQRLADRGEPARRPAGRGRPRLRMISAMPWLPAAVRPVAASSMSGYPRPELLATPSGWPPTSTGRRSGSSTSAGGPTGRGGRPTPPATCPGAFHLDWATDLADPDEDGRPYLLAGPEQVAAAMARVGVGDGTTVVLYDDTAPLIASRAWWSLRVYGLESVRILDGGYGGLDRRGPELSRTRRRPPRRPSSRRAAMARLRLTTADVRGPPRLAGRAAARWSGAGRVPRPGGQRPPARAHPGRDQRAGRDDDRAGHAAASGPADACVRPSSRRA